MTLKLTVIKLTIMEAKPELDSDRVDGKSDPEGNAEELRRLEMRETTSGKEHAHHRASSSDAQEHCNGARHPAQLERGISEPFALCACQ